MSTQNSSSNIAFIFDHDGVIADNEKLHKKAWDEMIANNGLEVSDKDYMDKAKGFTTKDALKNIFPEMPQAEIERLRQEKVKIYDGLIETQLKPVPGVIDFIKNAKKTGVKIVIASAAYRNKIEQSLNRFRLTDYVDLILSVEDVSKAKPDPEVYVKAMKLLNLKPSESIIFEDSIPGLKAANDANAKVVFVNTSNLKINDGVKYQFKIKNFKNMDPQHIINKSIT